VDEWISQIIRTFGRLDGAANIAGIAEGSGDTLIETIVWPVEAFYSG